jgi:single-stranded-DNA-specific exonuclease
MMTHWLDPQPIDVPAVLRDATGGHPLVAEMLARRGILTAPAARAFLDPAAYTPADPADFPDMDRAVTRLRQAIQNRERIAVWGDFDADGQTSTALLVETLQVLGASVTFHIPGRNEGHGVHERGVERLVGEGAGLILTCDTGITAHAAVTRTNQLGAEVIITDHHVLGERLPPALAVINPHRLPAGHPLGTLPGVGVAYELARALNPTVADRALDLVALGIVADVATLTGDARYLVQRGLEALRSTERPGLQAIYQAADLRPEGLTEEHISFVLGPRLNALGRLADAAGGVELLTTDDLVRARTLATEVESLNVRRQWLTKQITDAALAQIERDPSLLNDYHILVLSHPTWPNGVVGIVAGRLAQRLGKPAVLISTPPGEIARASGRSVPGVDIIAAITDCASLLEGYGGHPAAAGFSIEPERIPELRATLSRAVAARTRAIPEPVLAIDAYVELPDLTLDLVAEINRLAPFGPGNPPLILAIRDLHILSEATIGRTGEHRRLTVEDTQDRPQTVFWWQGADWPLPEGHFDLALTVRASDYRGLAEVQVEWIDARQREPQTAEVHSRPEIQGRDYRTVSNDRAVLQGLLAQGDVQVWAEGDIPAGIPTRTRQQLAPAPRLAVWTLPAGRRELQAALLRAQPEQVIWFAHNPGLDNAPAFLQRLAGLVKYALQAKGGQIDLEVAAAALAHRCTTVQTGLEWLAARGQITILARDDDHWQLAPGPGQPDPQATDAARARLDALLAETAAYRAYLRTAPAAALLQT